MDTTTISLGKVRILEALSQGTLCFSCSVRVNGRIAFTAKNTGEGGATRFTVLDRNLYQQAIEYAQGLPPIYTDPPDVQALPMTLELLIAELVEKAREEKWLRKRCQKAVLWRTPDMPPGKWNTIRGAASISIVEFVAIKNKILEDHPEAEIANLRFLKKK